VNAWLAVALGGAAGSVARLYVATLIHQWLGRDFPWGTLTVNVVGGLLMGLLTELLVIRYAVAAEWRSLLLVGFLGGFTTFSTFSMETWMLVQEGDFAKAVLNVLASVVLCVTAVWMGLNLARWGVEEEWIRWLKLETVGARLAVVLILAWLLGEALGHWSARFVWPENWRIAVSFSVIGVLAPLGAWYALAAVGGASMTTAYLVLAGSTVLSGSGVWLGTLGTAQKLGSWLTQTGP
jgi:CrcB protein